MQMDENHLSNFDFADVEAVVANELNRIAKYERHSNPSAVLLAGQPGAGKTVPSSMLSKALHDDVFFINADEYRRFHPHYQELHRLYGSDAVQMTSAFSGAVTEALIHALSEEKLHLIIEGTGRTMAVPRRTAELPVFCMPAIIVRKIPLMCCGLIGIVRGLTRNMIISQKLLHYFVKKRRSIT